MESVGAESRKKASGQSNSGVCSKSKSTPDSTKLLRFVSPVEKEQQIRAFLEMDAEMEKLALKNLSLIHI